MPSFSARKEMMAGSRSPLRVPIIRALQRCQAHGGIHGFPVFYSGYGCAVA